MSGNVTPFLDYKNSTDSGENNSLAIQPITNGEQINQATLQRPSENLRQRTEAVRSFATDSLYLQNADRAFLITGPGLVTWPGSTTAAADGKPVLSDVLWILPMLTPGSAQIQPIPPVQSAYGTLHLKRASDNMDSILVTSQRRSYAAGDQINIEVSAGAAFSCTLQTEDTGAYRRTIKVVATAATTLGDVISGLNGLIPPAPDNTQLVTAALEGGALNTDLVLDTQARQFVAGNYDGEGHTITPANLASFFTSNPAEALAEGDTLCVQFAMLSDTASTGGRRQAIPENSNTTITAGMFFNSRVHPEKLVNALPICKVVNDSLVFATGVEVPAGSVDVPLFSTANAANLQYAGGPAWADGTTNPATTVESQLDKIVTDLAASTGGAKIGGAAVGGGATLAADTLNAQIADLAANWGKKSAANAWSAAQTFDAGIVVPNGQDIQLQGDARVAHGTRTVRHATMNNCAGFTLGGTVPSDPDSDFFGSDAQGGPWLVPIPWFDHWRLTAARIFITNAVTGAGGTVVLVERTAGATAFASYTFVGGESGLTALTGLTPATHAYPLVLKMDLAGSGTSSAWITYVELDYDVQP